MQSSNPQRIRKRDVPRYFQRPGLGAEDFGAQSQALKIGSGQFQRPGLGVEIDVLAVSLSDSDS